MDPFQKAREETLACKQGLVHLNNAGCSLPAHSTSQLVIEYLTAEELEGGYELCDKPSTIERVEKFYSSVAQLLNARSNEIAFTENATRAWCLAFYSIPFEAGDTILTSEAEYASNMISALQIQRKLGLQIKTIPSSQDGITDVEALSHLLREGGVKCVCITHIPTNGGLINPIEAIGTCIKEISPNTFYIVDACQSAGQLPLDVELIQCSFLSATGRKYLRGPRGSGFLYVSSKILETGIEPAMLDLHAAFLTAPNKFEMHKTARRFECWEKNISNLIGLGAAVEYALCVGIDRIFDRNKHLAQLLRSELEKIGALIHDLGPPEHRSGIVSFTFQNAKTTPVCNELKLKLRARKINTSVSVWAATAFDMQKRGIDCVIRASVHYYNDESDIAALISALKELCPPEQ